MRIQLMNMKPIKLENLELHRKHKNESKWTILTFPTHIKDKRNLSYLICFRCPFLD